MSTIQNPNGYDIIFSPNLDASSPYDHEIEPEAELIQADSWSRTLPDPIVVHTPVANSLITGSIISAGGFGTLSDGIYTVTVIDDQNFQIDGTTGAAFSAPTGGRVIQIYNTDTGANSFWVKLPTLSHTVDTEFYMFYNKAGVTTSPENVAPIWANAKGVYHFPRGYPFTPYNDSTGNGGDLVQSSNVITQNPGLVGKGIGANTGGDFLFKSSYTLDITDFVLCFWVNTQNGGPRVVQFDTTNHNNAFIQNGGSPFFPSWTSQNTGFDFTTLHTSQNQWWFFAIRISNAGATAKVFAGIPGAALSTESQAVLPTDGTVTQLNVYVDVSASTAEAFIDELEIYPTSSISDDWITTLFNNQGDTAYVTIGPELSGNDGYNFKRKITVDHTMVSGSSNLTDFPLVIQTALLPVGPPPPPPDITGDVRYTVFSGGASSVTPPPTPPPIIVTRKCKPNMRDFI